MSEYLVRVDDNFHFSDEDERYTAGEFDTWEEALAKAKSILDRCLLDDLKQHPGITADSLYERYKGFGDDPFIVADSDQTFSAWTYAEQRCRELCSTQPRGGKTMAFSVKIKAMGPGFGENNLAFELPWWPENELKKDERFVVSNDTDSYFDYDAELTVEETRELYEKYKQRGLEGIYDGEG